MKKLVIFDLDGTLLDSAEGITKSMNFALRKLNLKDITIDFTRKYICEGTEKFALHACMDAKEKADECHRIFIEHYGKNASENTPLFDGIADLLASLENYDIHIAVLTNKPRDIADAIVKKLLNNYSVECVVGHTDTLPLKPDPAGVEKILSKLKIAREDTMLVGDGEADAKTAENAGIDFIGVLWGNRTKKELKETGAVYFAKNPDALLNIILYKYGKKRVSKLYDEFKKFITKGNVLDMAVGVIVGAAFSAIVNSLVKDIINPAVSIITGGISLSDLKFIIRPEEKEIINGVEKIIKPAVAINYGSFIQAVLNFLLIALTVFAIVKTVLAIRKKLDYNENIRKRIQEKLDNDINLNRHEKRWMIKEGKKDKAHLPRKTKPVTPPAPPKPTPPPEPILTDKLLTEILSVLKSQKSEEK